MLQTPSFHYDLMRQEVPEGWLLFEAIRRAHERLSNEDLLQGRVSKFLDELDPTSKAMCYAMLMYERFDQHTFVVGPRVQDLFRRTELTNVTEDMIVPPAGAFYVGLPHCPWKVWGGSRTRLHEVRGVYVSFSRAIPHRDEDVSRRCANFVIWGGTNERSVGPGDDAVLWHSVNLDRCFDSGQNLEEFFRQSRVMTAKKGDEGSWDGHDPLDPDPFDTSGLPEDEAVLLEQQQMLVNVLRLALNVCLYTASEEPDLEVVDPADEAADLRRQIARKKSEGKRRKLERRLQNLKRTRIVYIGPLFEQMEEPASRGASSSLGGTHASPIEHSVPPHYQRYWVGSEERRRRVWRYKGMYVRGTGKPDRTIVKIRE